MKPRVRQKLEQIFSYPFFESVGKPVSDSVTQITTWRIAAAECSKIKWGNCRLQGRNVLQRAIENQYPKPGMWERCQEWDSVVEEIKLSITPFVESIIPRIPLPDQSKEKIKPRLLWDFLFIPLETEYDDIVEPGFFIKNLEPWYAIGHFPCGWDGEEFPNAWDGIIRQGKLMVF